MALKDVYSNQQSTGFTINFFYEASERPATALLAAPFFTSNQAIKILTDKGCKVSLVVRFSPATTPSALREALDNSNVRVRFFTDPKFHTKLYIVDDTALVGSANLTANGLNANRELSIVLLKERDIAFQELPAIFDGLWRDASVLTEGILKEYTRAYNSNKKPDDEDAFAKYLMDFVSPVSPKSVHVDSGKISKERTFLESLRRKYDEVLIPCHKEIMRVAQGSNFGRAEYQSHDAEIEMGRFLGWVRLIHGSGQSWKDAPLLDPQGRANRIAEYVKLWQLADDTAGTDMYNAHDEINNITNIRNHLCNPNDVNAMSMDEIFTHLAGCHAFYERLRFVSKKYGAGLPGIDRLRVAFKAENRVEKVRATVNYLLSGGGDPLERAYDCIYDDRYKLSGFGEACVMELLGWGSKDRPPFNNRTIRGMRFLGYDVEHLVAGE